MASPAFVCPADPDLLERLHQLRLVVRVQAPDEVAAAAARVRRTDNALICVLYDAPEPLEAVPSPDDWHDVPLALGVPALGRFRHAAPVIERLRGWNVRVYLPAAAPGGLLGLRIMSSLGLACCAVFDENEPDWTGLADLATWALLGPAAHAPIDPFAFIADRYDPGRYTFWGAPTFTDPRDYLHLDAAGRVALSPAELVRGCFIAEDVAALTDLAACAPYVARLNGWRRCFLESRPCATCPGWRVCLGAFTPHVVGREPACAAFVAELMDVVDQHRAIRAAVPEHERWRP